jgi:hypothetical protein
VHVTERLERIAALIEIGTVAKHPDTVLTEKNLAPENLPFYVLRLIEAQRIGMFQVNNTVLFRRSFLCQNPTGKRKA